MSRLTAAAAVALTLLLSACATAPRSGPRAGVEADAYSRQLLVTIHQPESVAVGLTGPPSQRYLQRRYGASPSVERVLTTLAREHGLDRVDGWAIASLDVYCEVLAVPTGRDVDEVIRVLENDPRVELVQRMNLFTTQTSSRYDDPYRDLQTGALAMEVEQAHLLATGRGVSIAIIDSAVDAHHPDLRGRVRVARDLVPAHPALKTGEAHGTAVAGIIGSAVNNNEGIIGVAPDVSIAALRACWAVTADTLSAQCSSFSLARALETALTLRPQVINLSLAGPEDPLLSRLLDEALARGIIVVAAQPVAADAPFPASHPKVLTAHAAALAKETRSPFELGAPGTEVLTTLPGASYAFLTGNSLAAAHLTGAVALLKERDPSLDADRVAALLASSTTYSAGRASINACRALEELAGAHLCAPEVELAKF